MAWPFSNVGEPNLNQGPGAAVPTSSTAITGSQAWLLGCVFKNNSAGTLTVTITDTAGNIVEELTIPAEATLPYEWPFRPVNGVKWFASGAGMLGHVWGYV